MLSVQEIEATILELLEEMQGDQGDTHEYFLKLRQTLDSIRAMGMPLPDDLVLLEKELSNEFEVENVMSSTLEQRHPVNNPSAKPPVLKLGFKAMLAEANACIETVSVHDLVYHLEEVDGVLIDVRDTIEREQEGAIPGSVHVSRGLLEFKADPESPAYEEALRPDQHIILYCGSGGRSALAAKTLLDMGYEDVSSLSGGFSAWQAFKKSTK
jgi:rhodanese-related sulfurtransferase